MVLIVASVYDVVSQVFSPPMLYRTEGEAARQFLDACNNPQSVVGSHPEDLKLMSLGCFDDTDGTFTGVTPKLICAGVKRGEADVQLFEASSSS